MNRIECPAEDARARRTARHSFAPSSSRRRFWARAFTSAEATLSSTARSTVTASARFFFRTSTSARKSCDSLAHDDAG